MQHLVHGRGECGEEASKRESGCTRWGRKGKGGCGAH